MALYWSKWSHAISTCPMSDFINICHDVFERDGIEGILIFGSYVQGIAAPESDIDVLCLTSRGDRTRSVYLRREGRPDLDISAYSYHQLNAFLSEKNWRNNQPLLALKSGQLLFDKWGRLGQLMFAAKSLWLLEPVNSCLRT